MNAPTKTVYAFNPITRAYAGEMVLDEGDRCPLEPGVWHIPGNCLEVAPPPLGPGQIAIERDGVWLPVDELGIKPPPAAAAPTLEERVAAAQVTVQQVLDASAKGFGYDGITGAISYADEPAVERYSLEGKAFRAWRSLAWAAFFALAQDVRDGRAELPEGVEAMAAALPKLDVHAMAGIPVVDPDAPDPAKVAADEAAAAEAAANTEPAPAPATTTRRKRSQAAK